VPKHPSRRRRQNLPAPTTKLPPAGSARKAPPLVGAASMLAETRAWWRTVWASPMAAVYLEADVPALLRMARLLDARSRGTGLAAELSEIRQLEDRFGLSPLARRRLQWEVDAARDAELARQAAAEEAAAAEQAAAGESGDGRYLRAVKASS
jgi:hypothetical protein